MGLTVACVTITAPGSVANLGPGLDSLALAVDLQNRYTVFADLNGGSRQPSPFIELEGKHSSDERTRRPASNFFLRSMKHALRAISEKFHLPLPSYPLFVREDVRIPPENGLGASASANVAGVLGAIGLLQTVHDNHDFGGIRKNLEACAGLAMDNEVSPDGICASLGGKLAITYLTTDDENHGDPLQSVRCDWQPVNTDAIRVTALIPNVKLLTAQSRNILPDSYSRQDVISNLSRANMIPRIFFTGQYERLREAMRDRLHQPQRLAAFYKNDRNKVLDLDRVFREAYDAGAYGCCLGGAGSAIIAIHKPAVTTAVTLALRSAFEKAASDTWSTVEVMTLSPVNEGADMTYGLATDPLPPDIEAWFRGEVRHEPSGTVTPHSNADLVSKTPFEWPRHV